jgi:signal transduction histidine kinase
MSVFVEGDAGAVFRGEQQDFEEMLGNLMDNACKWAERNVTVTVTDGDEALVIDVDDDGRGLSPDERIGALKRGVRLDETTPGTGLGLSIVAELAELHKGTFTLSDSPDGGLRARLRFPK